MAARTPRAKCTKCPEKQIAKLRTAARKAAAADLSRDVKRALNPDLTGPQVAWLRTVLSEAREQTDIFWQARALDALADLLDAAQEIAGELSSDDGVV